MTVTRRFRCQPAAIPAARGFVRDVLSDQPRALTDAAELLASELTTNCVRHAHTDFELTVEVDGHVRVEVRDRGAGTPTVLSPRPTDPSGRGLRIVEALSDDWGVEEGPDGKAVWFTLSQPVTTRRGRA